jgi:O-antigen ligase
VGNLVTGGLNGEAVIGPRSYALVGVVGVAWGVGHARFGSRRIGLLAPLCWLLITLSLSRLAFAASLLIIVIGSLDVRTAGRLVRSVLVIGTVAGLAYFSVTSFGPLASRFRPQGDLKSVGGVSVDVTGRTNLWHVTWVSYLRSPIIGQGAGSAETVIDRARGSANGQPHDDYIRVLHDYGIIGLVLLLAALAALLRHAGRATRLARKGDPATPIHLAAALAVVGLLAAMATDNAIVYPFVVVPIAVILGLSIGVSRRPAWR